MDEGRLNPILELAHLLRLQKYHKRKRRDLQARVDRLKLSCEIQRRLIRSQPNLQRNLADSIRTGNKSEFRAAFDAFRDVRDLATKLANGTHQSISADVVQEDGRSGDHSSFLDRISKDSRDHVLRFVSDLVSNQDFLIARLMSLNQRQLENIQLGQHLALPGQSVLAHASSSFSRRSSATGPASLESRAASQVSDLCRHDAFALILDLVGLYPSTDGGSVRRRQEHIWASVCARMLSENKPGREKFVIAILDGMAHEVEEAGKRSLESWIQETLRAGQFLLSQGEAASFQIRSQDASDEAIETSTDADAFYTRAARQLFILLKDNDKTKIIPSRVLSVCRLTVDKLRDSDTRFRASPFFFLAHWLFSTFMLDNIITPEARALMLDDAFPETARHRILREAIFKAQRIVFDVSYAWSHTGTIDPTLKSEVDAVAAIFKPVSGLSAADRPDSRSSDYFLRSLTPTDTHTLMQALYPEKRGGETAGLHISSTSSPRAPSSASSVSGLSIFRESTFDDIDSVRLPSIPGTGSNLSTESDVSSRETASPGDHVDSYFENPELRAMSLRQACAEINTVTRSERGGNLDNPLAESWALLELRSGRVRNIDRMHAFSAEQRELEIQSDSEAENGFRNDHDSNSAYLEIRRGLLRLLADPTLVGTPPGSVELRNSDMLIPFPSPHKQARNPFSRSGSTEVRAQRNPYRHRSHSLTEILNAAASKEGVQSALNGLADVGSRSGAGASGLPKSAPTTLTGVFQNAVYQLEENEDFTKAFAYSKILDRVRKLSSSNAATESALLRYFTRDVEHSIMRSRSASARLEILASLLEQQGLETESSMKAVAATISKTRIKMWYCTDVRSAAPYAELEKLAAAIVSMGQPKAVTPKKTEPPPLRHKGTLKPKNISAVKKAESSVVDIMITDPVYRVVDKLQDEQVMIVRQWMEKAVVENICSGEERIHRLLCEISKCLGQLISSDPVTSPVLWGSELFQRDRMDGEQEALHIELVSNDFGDGLAFLSRPSSNGSDHVAADMHARLRRRSDFNVSTTSMNSPELSIDFSGVRSPNTMLTRSSTTFWSPNGFRSQSPLSNVSPPSRTWSPMHLRQSISRESFQSATQVKGLLRDLQQSVTGLLVSDIVQRTYPDGSETDAAFFRGIGRDFLPGLPLTTQKSMINIGSETAHGKKGTVQDKRDARIASRSERRVIANGEASSSTLANGQSNRSFDLELAKRRLVRRFDHTSGPYGKLKILHDLETLLLSSTDTSSPAPPASFDLLRTRLETSLLSGQSSSRLSKSITTFQTLFSDSVTRPPNLFRDLQTMAALIPPEILDDTLPGRAFWSATMAALSLKSSLTQSMVEAADGLIRRHTTTAATNNDNTGPSPSPSPSSSTPSPKTTPSTPTDPTDPLTRASHLLRLAASQGHPVAQRELATLYLTHPELVPRALAPLAKTKDVFRASQAARWARENSDGSRKYDAETMCVAFHWMQMAAEGGDVLARGFGESRD